MLSIEPLETNFNEIGKKDVFERHAFETAVWKIVAIRLGLKTCNVKALSFSHFFGYSPLMQR